MRFNNSCPNWKVSKRITIRQPYVRNVLAVLTTSLVKLWKIYSQKLRRTMLFHLGLNPYLWTWIYQVTINIQAIPDNLLVALKIWKSENWQFWMFVILESRIFGIRHSEIVKIWNLGTLELWNFENLKDWNIETLTLGSQEIWKRKRREPDIY